MRVAVDEIIRLKLRLGVWRKMIGNQERWMHEPAFIEDNDGCLGSERSGEELQLTAGGPMLAY